MNKIRWIVLNFVFVFCVSFVLWNQGCSKPIETIQCKVPSDCTDPFYDCVGGTCRKKCLETNDCKDLGLTCTNTYCGGTSSSSDSTTPVEKDIQKECESSDSRSCYTGTKGTAGTGVCKEGRQLCTSEGKWGKCEGEIVPTAEQCNGKDDDCDGRIDNACGTSCSLGQTKECYPVADQSTKGVGPCKAGNQTCVAGNDGKPEWGQCENYVIPIPELCSNDKDDNCDGKVNEGCACKPGDQQLCKASNGCAGIQVCKVTGNTSDWGDCAASSPSDEGCDGFDNDCDGKIDNKKGSDQPLTQECKNVCFKGTETCKAGKWQDCDAIQIAEETCNGKDDDCDGKIDNLKNKEEPLIRGCTHPTAQGSCAVGNFELCEKGNWGTCTASKPVPETCNDLDDDCDGKIDEAEDKPCGDGMVCFKNTANVKICVPE